jgi:hypothetical protein
MKASKELLSYLGTLTKDTDTFPRANAETVGIRVGMLREIISILQFQNKEPYRGTISLLESQGQ